MQDQPKMYKTTLKQKLFSAQWNNSHTLKLVVCTLKV